MNENKTKKCKYCKSDIDAKAKICPNCKKRQGGNGCLAGILVAIILIAGVSMCGNNDSPTTNDTTGTQSVTETTTGTTTASDATNAGTTESVPKEYKSALKQAETYSKMMHMSKKGIYDQLTSEYGGQFSAEAAQYAVDNVKADWKANALKKAQTYQDDMAMSPNAIRDQLVSEYGEQFTAEEADYAIANLE
jgi:hypothetical protein